MNDIEFKYKNLINTHEIKFYDFKRLIKHNNSPKIMIALSFYLNNQMFC